MHQFKLVELGIVDADILISELSMPSALHTRVEAFERLAAVERWLRVALKELKIKGSCCLPSCSYFLKGGVILMRKVKES